MSSIPSELSAQQYKVQEIVDVQSANITNVGPTDYPEGKTSSRKAPSLLDDPESIESLCWNLQLPMIIFQTDSDSSIELNSFPDEQPEAASKKRKMFELAAVGGEITGLSGFLRYGGFLSILERTDNLGYAATYLALSTLLLEGASSESMPNILERHNHEPSRIIDKCSKLFDKLKVPQKLSPSATALTVYYAGVAPYQFANWRENPNIPTEENRRRGRIATLGITAITTLQGAVLGNAIKEYDDPKIVVPTALAALGVSLGGRKLKNRVFRKGDEENVV